MSVEDLDVRATAMLAQANTIAARRGQATLALLAEYRQDYLDRIDQAQESLQFTNRPHPFIDLGTAEDELAVCSRAQELAEEEP